MNTGFWKGKKVFITGHSGFKGSWLSLWLSSLGSNVMGYSLPPPPSQNIFSLINLSDGEHLVGLAQVQEPTSEEDSEVLSEDSE